MDMAVASFQVRSSSFMRPKSASSLIAPSQQLNGGRSFCVRRRCYSDGCQTVADKTLAEIRNSGVIACLRAQSAELTLQAASAALIGGISVLEIVISTPVVLEVLHQLGQDYPTATIGAGTVLNAKDAKNAVDAGAKFLMSPAMVKEIFDDVQSSECLYIPGAMTPTEIFSAYKMGAKIVKIYPVSALGGVQYMETLQKPFPHIPMVASQGITIESVGEYIAGGASAIVLSDAIFDNEAMSQRNFGAVSQLAHRAAFLGNEAVKRWNFCHYQTIKLEEKMCFNKASSTSLPDGLLPGWMIFKLTARFAQQLQFEYAT